MKHICTQDCITAGYCHKCGELVPLKKDTKDMFCKCSCGYQNKMEDLNEFLRPYTTNNFWNNETHSKKS